jgi:hypothetical protein
MPRQPALTLPSGRVIPLREASCRRCRRLLGVCRWDGHPVIWDALGFGQDGRIEFRVHVCRPPVIGEYHSEEAQRDARHGRPTFPPPPADPRD